LALYKFIYLIQFIYYLRLYFAKCSTRKNTSKSTRTNSAMHIVKWDSC